MTCCQCEIREANTCMTCNRLTASLSSLTLQLRFRKWSLARPQSHGFAGESWVGAPPFFPPEPAQGVLPVPLGLRLWHVPQNHVTQLLHQQWGVSTQPSSWIHHAEFKHVFTKSAESIYTHTHTQRSNDTLSQSNKGGCDCNYAFIMLMKSWWILLALTVVLCFLARLSASLSRPKIFH